MKKSDVKKFLEEMKEKWEDKYVKADEKDDENKMNSADEKLQIIENMLEELEQI